MNAMERVMSRLCGKPVDRVPWFGLMSLYGARLTGAPLEKHYRDPIVFAAGVDAVVERFHPDILATPFSLALEAEAYGCTVRQTPASPPRMIPPSPIEAAAWRERVEPDLESVPLQYLRRSLAMLLERHGANTPVISGLAGPLELAICLVGMENFMEMLLYNRAESHALMEKTTEHFVRWSNQLFSDGLPLGVFVGAALNASVLTRELAHEVRPYVEAALARIKGPVVFHHGGGPLLPVLPEWLGLPHVVGYFADPRDDLTAMRSLVGPGPLLLGTLNGPQLSAMTAVEVEQAAGDMLRQMRDDPAFILGTSGADIPMDTPEENIAAIAQAVAKEAATVMDGAT